MFSVFLGTDIGVELLSMLIACLTLQETPKLLFYPIPPSGTCEFQLFHILTNTWESFMFSHSRRCKLWFWFALKCIFLWLISCKLFHMLKGHLYTLSVKCPSLLPTFHWVVCVYYWFTRDLKTIIWIQGLCVRYIYC